MMRVPRGIRNVLGLLLYLLLMGILLQFDWGRMLQPVPMISVLAGTVILTLSQWKRETHFRTLISHARWNAFLAGMLTSLFGMLSLLSGDQGSGVTTKVLADTLLPLLYGGLFALPWSLRGETPMGTLKADAQAVEALLEDPVEHPSHRHSAKPHPIGNSGYKLSSAEEIHRILKLHGFTPRECHVAQKLLEDVSNRDIAESLYISETTVKKHIQNLFRKCGATDRRTFRKLFQQWVETTNS